MSSIRRAFFEDFGVKKLSRVRFLEMVAAIIKDLDNVVTVGRTVVASF